jgi:enoyl-CoA hydratase
LSTVTDGWPRFETIAVDDGAKDLLFTGRHIDAEEALRSGLVSSVVEPAALLETAEELAARILRSSPAALRLTKLSVNAPAGAHPAVELAGQAVLFEDPEKARRMSEFIERREKS